ncbi:MAG: CBS domain-containing protein [Planctomycetota bacterium]|jgi:CBS domain-containing protein
MNVKDVMTREVRSVRMADRLDAAARLMWEQDCGIAPVVDSSHVLVGVLTDRDLCMATYTQGRPLSEIPVTAVMARMLRTIKPDDTLATAMGVLQQAQVHRLPVVDARGVLVGLLAVNDLVRLAATRPGVLDATAVVKCLAAIGASRRATNAGSASASASAPAAAPAVAPLGAGGGKPVKVVAAASSSPSPAPSASVSAPLLPTPLAPVVVPTAKTSGKAAAKAAKGNKPGKGKKG